MLARGVAVPALRQSSRALAPEQSGQRQTSPDQYKSGRLRNRGDIEKLLAAVGLVAALRRRTIRILSQRDVGARQDPHVRQDARISAGADDVVRVGLPL